MLMCVRQGSGTSLHCGQQKQGVKDVVKGAGPPSVVLWSTSRVWFPWWHNLYNPQACPFFLQLRFSLNVEVRFIFWGSVCCSSSSVCGAEERASSYRDADLVSQRRGGCLVSVFASLWLTVSLPKFESLPPPSPPQDWEGLSSWSWSLWIKPGFIPHTFIGLVSPRVSFCYLLLYFYILAYSQYFKFLFVLDVCFYLCFDIGI